MLFSLVQSPEDPSGERETADPPKPGTDDAGASGANDAAGSDDAGKGEDVKPDKQDPPAQDAAGSETDGAGDDADDITEDDVAKATPKVARQYRTIKRENVGLQAELEESAKDIEEAPVLLEKVATLERENLILELAGLHGLNPDLLRPVKGTREEMEKWIMEFTEPGSPSTGAADAGKDAADAGKTGDDKTDDSAADEGKDEKADLPVIGDDHPKPKGEITPEELAGMSNEERAKYWGDKI